MEHANMRRRKVEQEGTSMEKTDGKFTLDSGDKEPTGQYTSLGHESGSTGTLELADKGKLGDTKTKSKEATSLLHRQDVWAWVGGVVFILALSGAIWGIGLARGWDANSGHTHNVSATSAQRFWPEPYTLEAGVKGRDGAEADSRWYYWKLPPDQVTAGTQAFVWVCYVSHQILVWAATYIHQQQMSHLSKEERYSVSLSKWNWIALALNGLFHLLHLLQTHTTYDALAQDVSIASSQGSVIMLLVFIVLMEYKRRGLLFGWPTEEHTGIVSRKLRLNYDPIDVIRRYHGYAFSWAAVYTFWYHPMENTWGHVLGFAHTWMIMLQGSLAFTRMHLDVWWRLLLEAWVTLHGAVVAYQTGGPDQLGTKLWPMFLFGFALVLCFTQVYSLPFWKAIHWAWRAIPPLVYVAVALYCYSWIPDAQGRPWVRLQEVIRIPAVYYLFFLLAYVLLFLLLKLEAKIRGEDSKVSPVTVRKQALFLTIIVLIFAIFVGLSAAVQFGDVQMGLIVLMIIFVGVFVVGVCVMAMLLRQLFPGHGKVQDAVTLNGIFTSANSGNEVADGPKKS